MPGHRRTGARHGGTASHRRLPKRTTTTRARPSSCGELFPALEPASAKHFAALGCRHALAEAVFFAALALLGLISHLSHMGFPPLSSKQRALYRVDEGCVNQAQNPPRTGFPSFAPSIHRPRCSQFSIFRLHSCPVRLVFYMHGGPHERKRTGGPPDQDLLCSSSNSLNKQPSRVWWHEGVVFRLSHFRTTAFSVMARHPSGGGHIPPSRCEAPLRPLRGRTPATRRPCPVVQYCRKVRTPSARSRSSRQIPPPPPVATT